MEGFLAVGVFLLTVAVLMLVSSFVQGPPASRQAIATLDRGERHRRNTKTLWALVVLAVVATAVLRLVHPLTGSGLLDGSIGVAIGLFICAHPAANAINVLFFERDALRGLSDWTAVRWLALNLLTLLAGWMVIFVSLRRLFDRAA
jgi:hypothetical protein